MRYNLSAIRKASLTFTRKITYNTGQEFATAKKQFPRRYVNLGIFGATFGLGYLASRFFTYSDLAAWLLYDKLPVSEERITRYEGSLLNRAADLPITKELIGTGYMQVFPDRNENDVLVNKTLKSPGAITIDPLFFFNPTTKSVVGIYHLGMKLTGYPLVVHGGILATVLEDQIREAAKVITGSAVQPANDLEISYKFPTIANQFVIIKTTDFNQLGDTANLEATILNQSGKRVLVTGKATFSIK
ncbi:HGL342Cp [Eremothecium sinecaudum]|uniref:HGL342Cp n=1 Tax=Eremothecium sinecaudum TaxID=45286 RepID=A0A0X8HV67_9SACH|nr:HGL342Cp [Eremothecium sinecaudum]AMD21998.1 HGL342Cp [Eremothecium sinecaudum]